MYSLLFSIMIFFFFFFVSFIFQILFKADQTVEGYVNCTFMCSFQKFLLIV
jgi:hypothetical protein